MKKQKRFNPLEKQDDTTSFEKFATQVKITIFNILYVLLKDEEPANVSFVIFSASGYLQIYYLSFATPIDYPWKSGDEVFYLQTFIEYFQLTTWYHVMGFSNYLVCFYIQIFIVCLVILDIVYVSYSFTKNKFAFVWPLQALRSVCGLFVTALFMPFLETFFFMFECQKGDSGWYHSAFVEQECWRGLHLIHATSAMLISIIFIIISVVVALTLFDSSSTSIDNSARVHSRTDAFALTAEIVMTILYVFFPTQQWFLIVLLNTISFFLYKSYRDQWPYYNDNMNIYFRTLSGIFMWSNFCLLVAKILEHTDFTGALQVYFYSLPLVIAFIIFSKDERVALLIKNINNFKQGHEVALQIRYFLKLVHSKDKNRKNAIILNGYIYHHEDSCLNNDCQLKMYKNQLMQTNKSKKTQKKYSQETQNQNNYQLLLQHAKNMYRVGIQKFPECTTLKIQYAFFLMERLDKKNEAIQILTQAEKFDPPFDEQFIIYRCKKMNEGYGDLQGEDHGEGLDVVKKFAYESSFRQFSLHIEESAKLHFEFWSLLREDMPDIQKLNKCGSKINKSIAVIASYWNKLQKLNPNVPKALKTYAKFLIEILNDKDAGNELISRFKEAIYVKKNFFDANHLNDDSNDPSSMSSNGTPCVYVQYEEEKSGIITKFNQGVSRVFGYTSLELKDHNVERLMPEMYAVHHSKVVDEAIQKSSDRIASKERLVFGRHKSGYVFPVWIQTKIIENSANGIQLFALFKIDKSLISSDICYILLNNEKKIQGISSSCMKMINIDIHKVKRLSQNGISINKLAPSLFGNEHSDHSFASKQGSPLEWSLIEYENPKKIIFTRGNSHNEHKDAENHRLIVSSQKVQFICHLNTIVMGDLGEIGWYIKLIPNSVQKNSQISKKLKEKVRQPLFQFRYNDDNGKFIREIKDSLDENNEAKDPNFVNGHWLDSTQIEIKNNDKKLQEEQVDFGSNNDEKTEVDHKDIKLDVPKDQKPSDKDYSHDLLEKRKNWGKKIKIYKLVNGNFQAKQHDEEIKKQQQIEEEQRKKLLQEEQNNQNTYEEFKTGIKSKKALQVIIGDKSVPKSISNLKLTMNTVLLSLLVLSIAQFSVLNFQFKEINSNFNLIQQQYGRISEVQKITYNLRTLILINEGLLTNYQQYSSTQDFVSFMITDSQKALTNLYLIHNQISLSNLQLKEDQQSFIESKSVKLYFVEQNNTLKTIYFSLTEAVLQIASAAFTTCHLNLKQFQEADKNIYFIIYNGYNDFLSTLRLVSKYYVDELITKTMQKNQISLIFFSIAITVLVLTIFILIPVVSRVNQAKIRVLSLFMDIPIYNVLELENKCEGFLMSYTDENPDEHESNEADKLKAEDEGDDDDDSMIMSRQKGSSKNRQKFLQSNQRFFIQFSVVAVMVISYFAAIYILSSQYSEKMKVMTEEMNMVAQIESYYSFALNTQREMIYNSSKPILGDNSFLVAKDSLEQLYELNQHLLDNQFKNRHSLSSNFLAKFRTVFQHDLCNMNIVQISLIPYECHEFLSGSATNGLEAVLVRYFETLKENLEQYLILKDKNQDVKILFNNEKFMEMYIMQFRFIEDTFRSLVTVLNKSANSEFSLKQTIILAAFVVFVVCIGFGYLVVWMPYVNKHSKEILRTKSMLTIIPIKVILKIPTIQEFLKKESYSLNKKQGQ